MSLRLIYFLVSISLRIQRSFCSPQLRFVNHFKKSCFVVHILFANGIISFTLASITSMIKRVFVCIRNYALFVYYSQQNHNIFYRSQRGASLWHHTTHTTIAPLGHVLMQGRSLRSSHLWRWKWYTIIFITILMRLNDKDLISLICVSIQAKLACLIMILFVLIDIYQGISNFCDHKIFSRHFKIY